MAKQFILDLVKAMTLEEKAAQLTQLGPNYFDEGAAVTLTGPYRNWNLTKEIVQNAGSVLGCVDAETYCRIQDAYLKKNRHHIPLLFMADIIHGMKTIFPIPLAIGGSFDLELCKQSAEIAAAEASVCGLHVTFSPMADLVRDPRWGRVMESPGEDPYLNAEMTRAMVRGYQGKDLKEPGRLAACIKHFAAYGAPEGGREYNTVDISKGMLREYYLPAYRAAVEENVAMAMTSFNTVERVPSSGNVWLLRELLRKEWGFQGVIISDFNALDEIINHSIAADIKEAAQKCITAGVDIEMMSACYVSYLPELVRTGTISEEFIDEAVVRILELKDQLGLFENPYKDADKAAPERLWLCKKHREAARKLAGESAVLLKNNGILPLPLPQEQNAAQTAACAEAGKSLKIGIAGPFAESRQVLGGWAGQGETKDAVSLAEGLRNVLGKENVITAMTEEVKERLSGFLDVSDETENALETLQECDIILAAVGEHPGDSGEAGSKAYLRLSPNQEKLLRKLKRLNKPVITIIFAGRPMEIEPIVEDCDALLYGWFLGTEMGNALADILFGKVNPSGRLSMTIPRTVGQVPIYYNSFHTGRPFEGLSENERFASRYIDCDNSPLYPFGYGLSYSEFMHKDLKLETGSGRNVKASVQVKNISKRAGTTVVQLYLRDVTASVVRPVKELKGFRRVWLEPGEEQEVSFEITEEMLKYYNNEDTLVFEPGEFEIMIGENSEEVLKTSLFIG